MAYNQHVQKIVGYQEKAINKTRDECIAKYGVDLLSEQPYFDPLTNRIMCPPFFDTIYCWPPQLPNTTTSVSCPSYVLGFILDQNATRRCNENGEWFRRNGVPYTNYSACFSDKLTTVYTNISKEAEVNDVSPASVNLIKALSETGYAVSLISLIIAFSIMFKIKKLHCARNILHMNLFASFILRSFMHILKDTLFEDGLGLSKDMVDHNGTTYFHIDATLNNFECKLIVSLVQYFTAANYSWILMEGVYLNNLILRALFTDSNRSLVYYITFGWGLPLLVVVPWVIARILVEDSLCWTTNDNLKVFAIIVIPTFTSVLINLVLFVIISVVLYSKLKSPINEDSRRYLKWAKSTLVLVPLFGVNYAFFLIFYFLNEKIIWMLCDILFGSFQGFFVAILYCFMNGEVKSEVKPYINSVLIFLATNNVTKCCFPGRDKYLSSADGRQSVCTTMSCSSLYNNGVNQQRTNKTKLDQLSKIKLTNLHEDGQGGSGMTRECSKKLGRHNRVAYQINNNLTIVCRLYVRGFHCRMLAYKANRKCEVLYLLFDNGKEFFIPNGVRHSVPKTGSNGHYVPNLTFVHGRYPVNMTTAIDASLAHEVGVQCSRNMPICEEEVCMLDEINSQSKLDDKYSRRRSDS